MLGLALSFLVTGAATGEDLDLRNRAEQFMNRALLVSRLTTPINIRTEVSFSATGDDGIATAGSYVRVRSVDNALREDFVLGDYQMSRIQEQGRVATRGQWVDIPYPFANSRNLSHTCRFGSTRRTLSPASTRQR